MKKVTNAVNAVHGKSVIPIFFGEDETPYIGKAFWDSLCLRDDLFIEPETQQVLHEDERVNRTEFIRVSTFPDVIKALHRCRTYIRYFEYISDEDIDDLSEALSHWVKGE
ncbi:hypothetical protein HOT49_gp288 [Erwinia phage vB_EamM_Alexandra]|uniref:Uncharacterized protein n=1 Tax=Erwinia phage vB_EamM_Alexandra TaxID=2201424 RepID=A0A2Z4QEL0_9CAUD|nr:hypothetical protein HOT49_gp288 [Erwinia phage vB_EamM_Alexandra]AWY08547.1 hypothetical protein Alexandra_291 [Erwinia phage vB_EamM_Alexandra]